MKSKKEARPVKLNHLNYSKTATSGNIPSHPLQNERCEPNQKQATKSWVTRVSKEEGGKQSDVLPTITGQNSEDFQISYINYNESITKNEEHIVSCIDSILEDHKNKNDSVKYNKTHVTNDGVFCSPMPPPPRLPNISR